MKNSASSVTLRLQPEDFRVEELSDFPISREGDFAVYRLTKTNRGTLEAVADIMHRWKLDRRWLSWGGLKDRHAVTRQFLTIRQGPRRGLSQGPLSLEYLGQANREFMPADIRANRFSIVVRNLNEAHAAGMEMAIQDVCRDGLVNYFGDQRFGSVTTAGEFIARPWIAGDYEQTIRLALAAPQPRDQPQERRQKELLRQHWGDWKTCFEKLLPSPRRTVVGRLRDRPTDFRGAWGVVNRDLRGLYLAAYQASLWNQLAAEFLRAECPPEAMVEIELRSGRAGFPLALQEPSRSQVQKALLPLPSARLKPDPGPLAELMQRVLAANGIELRQLRVKFPRDSFFSKGWRALTVQPEQLAWTSATDELHPERRRLNLDFVLPRGAYATVFLKRIVRTAAWDEEFSGDSSE